MLQTKENIQMNGYSNLIEKILGQMTGRMSKFYVDENSVNAQNYFSSSGGLKLARELFPGMKGVNLETLKEFARTPLEKYMMGKILDADSKTFSGYDNTLKALFRLRVIDIPLWCRKEIEELEAQNDETDNLWLTPFGPYVLGFERMMFERLYRSFAQADREVKKKGFKLFAEQKFKLGVHDWFDDTPEPLEFWMYRYDQWRHYAAKSLNYFLGRQSRDKSKLDSHPLKNRCNSGFNRQAPWMQNFDSDLQAAVTLGIYHRFESLPLNVFGDRLLSFKNKPHLKELFDRNAKQKQSRQKSLPLNTWLIEIWPLVFEYGLNFHDVTTLAIKTKQPGVAKDQKTSQIEDRCKELGLKLGPEGRKRAGFPKGAWMPIRRTDNPKNSKRVNTFQRFDDWKGLRRIIIKRLPRGVSPIGDDPSVWIYGRSLIVKIDG